MNMKILKRYNSVIKDVKGRDKLTNSKQLCRELAYILTLVRSSENLVAFLVQNLKYHLKDMYKLLTLLSLIVLKSKPSNLLYDPLKHPHILLPYFLILNLKHIVELTLRIKTPFVHHPLLRKMINIQLKPPSSVHLIL